MTLSDGFHDVAAGKLATVVTYLEMTSQPELRNAPLPDTLVCEDLKRDPDIYRDVFRRIGSDWLWFERLKMPDAELRAILDNPDVTFITLTRNGTPEALLELDYTSDAQCELAYFGVTPALIGTGAGAYLMDLAITQAWAKPITRFYVHTCTFDSPQALGFYTKSGFTPFKRQVEIFEDPRLVDLHPKDAAPSIPKI